MYSPIKYDIDENGGITILTLMKRGKLKFWDDTYWLLVKVNCFKVKPVYYFV